MKRKVYHVVPYGDRWSLKAEGNQRSSGLFSTQEEAIARGREVARARGCSQLLIHGQDGEIKDERTYGSDPYPPAG